MTEGNYNLTLVLSQPLDENAAVFCDYVENAYLFKVAKRNPNRIWNLVYIKNEYKVNYVSDAIKS